MLGKQAMKVTILPGNIRMGFVSTNPYSFEVKALSLSVRKEAMEWARPVIVAQGGWKPPHTPSPGIHAYQWDRERR